MNSKKYLENLGKVLRKKREKKYSQEEMAFRLNRDRSHYGGIERGEYNLKLSTLIELAEELNCMPSELLREVEELKNKKD